MVAAAAEGLRLLRLPHGRKGGDVAAATRSAAARAQGELLARLVEARWCLINSAQAPF